jgi:ArpU family phage transcriptional regulator
MQNSACVKNKKMVKEGFGMTQMEFKLPSIDRDETKKVLEAALEKYRIIQLRLPYENTPKITTSFSLELKTFSNQFNSSTEDAALENVHLQIEGGKYIKRISDAVNRLSPIERTIMIRRYLNEDDEFDYQIYNDLNMSERKYYRIKARAFYKLAFALKVEVYNQKEGNVS